MERLARLFRPCLLLAVFAFAAVPSASAQKESPAQTSAATAALLEQAIVLHRAGRLAEAEAAYATALKAAEQLQDPRDTSAVVKVLGWQANLYRQQGRFAESWHAAERALPLHEAAFGPDDPYTAYLHGLLGSVAMRLGQHAVAEQHLRAVLAVYSRNGGGAARNEATANAAHELGNVLVAQKRWAEAVTVLQVGIALRSATAPPNAAALARVTQLLAVAFEGTGQIAESEATHKAAVTVVEDQQGPAVATLVDMLVGQAVFYRNQRRYEDAWSTGRRAAAAYEKGSTDKLQPARIHALLAGIALLRNDKALAEAEYRLALAAYDSAPASINLALAADVASELAAILMGKANNVEAATLLERSISLQTADDARQRARARDLTPAAGTRLQGTAQIPGGGAVASESAGDVQPHDGRRRCLRCLSDLTIGDLLFAAGRYGRGGGAVSGGSCHPVQTRRSARRGGSGDQAGDDLSLSQSVRPVGTLCAAGLGHA